MNSDAKSCVETVDYCIILQYKASRARIMTIRQKIHDELQRRRWSRYRLEKELQGKIPARTVYAYLSGHCDLGSDRVSIMLQTLGLTITNKTPTSSNLSKVSKTQNCSRV